MKKRVLMFVLGVTIFIAGCGKENNIEPPVSQIMEETNITMDTETESHTEVGTDDFSNCDESDKLDAYMKAVKEQSDIIKDSLENDTLTQMDMNIKSRELYEIWDAALNYLWDELKNCLSEKEFSELLGNQRIWISEKEKSVEEAGKEVEGGSLYSLVVNMEAAKITEERVYELYKLLK